jgi:hypothetical protein
MRKTPTTRSCSKQRLPHNNNLRFPAYTIDLFSSETFEIFSKSNQDVSGSRLRRELF